MVIIVGAGIAGLSCANYLKSKNIDFLVLDEADKRPGLLTVTEKRYGTPDSDGARVPGSKETEGSFGSTNSSPTADTH